MKKIIIYLFSLCLLLSSCGKNFLQLYPNESVDANAVFSSMDGAWGAINGIHRSMYNQYYDVSCGGVPGLCLHTDIMADDLILSTRGRGVHVNSYQWMAHNLETSTICFFPWRMIYQIISNANAIIINIDKISGDPGELAAIKGQAQVYRAWGYFQLVQLYGKRYETGKNNSQPGVPVYTDVTFSGKARSSVEAVYVQINQDLDDAISNLKGYVRANKSHLDISVAKGMKARVALMQGKWEDAAKFAAEAREGYSFMSGTQQMEGYCDYTNPEYMWGSHVQPDQTLYYYSYYSYMAVNFATTDVICIPKELYDHISATDVRKKFWYPTAGEGGPKPAEMSEKVIPTNYMNSKFKAAGSGDSRGDFPHMRIAEMYLIEAEAYARDGSDGLAQNALYTLVKNRDPKYQKSTKTGEALLNEILVQRRIELWGEGFRWFDLKRLNLPLDRKMGDGKDGGHDISVCGFSYMDASKPDWTWAIPLKELESNPLMEKN